MLVIQLTSRGACDNPGSLHASGNVGSEVRLARPLSGSLIRKESADLQSHAIPAPQSRFSVRK